VDNQALRQWAVMKFGRTITEEELARRTSPVWPYKYFNPGKPVDPATVDELLRGAIDVHVHGAPLGAWLAGRPSMVETSLQASEAGMKALVFKDHNTMSNNCAIIIQDFLDRMARDKASRGETFTPTQVYGGIVLNHTVGGLNARAVEVALGYGRCKEVWLPSLDARHQQAAMGFEGGIDITDGKDLRPEMTKILSILSDYNSNSKGERCALSACHVSNEEKFALMDYVKDRGLNLDVFMDHVTQELTILTPDEAKALIDKGAYLQFAQCSCVPWAGMQDWIIAFDYSFKLIKELIEEKGPDHLVLISDAGQPGNPPVPGWRSFLRTLLAQGVSRRDIEIMAKEVPARLIGIER
jgi:hypothetical protein